MNYLLSKIFDSLILKKRLAGVINLILLLYNDITQNKLFDTIIIKYF
ncbi:hypothetical protein SAMN02745132_01511 [Enterovibrio nigricans DSM 22720]|uniref:Uncharacterized protein n=1 Tax=Enterovibrio nigricans DSM 22720 TaxID=1121868 RepID=A0A1T4UEH9_9GAMM|nr:hypothetical protein SAMN02745132_01511 [Enterovibrio nigricans DSM 22720]